MIKDIKKLKKLGYDKVLKSSMEGYYIVYKNGKKGCVNEFGEVILPCEFDSIKYAKSQEAFLVAKNEKEGLFDVEGEEIVPCVYDSVKQSRSIKTFFEDGYLLKKGEEYSLVDAEGKVIISEGLVLDDEGNLGFYSKSDKMVKNLNLEDDVLDIIEANPKAFEFLQTKFFEYESFIEKCIDRIELAYNKELEAAADTTGFEEKLEEFLNLVSCKIEKEIEIIDKAINQNAVTSNIMLNNNDFGISGGMML